MNKPTIYPLFSTPMYVNNVGPFERPDLKSLEYSSTIPSGWSYTPKTNDICLFPSVVMHAADPNESDEEQSCLAFNVFVRGDIGSLHKLSIR